MSNIKNLRMGTTVCADRHVSIQTSFFGLCTKALYNVTGSVIDARSIELSRADGECLQHILEAPVESLAEMTVGVQLKKTVNGQYMAEVCTSRDGEFAAVMLMQFIRMSYEPVTDVTIYEGENARLVCRMF